MKQFIQNSPIKNKLILIIMSTVITSLLLAGTAVIISERFMMKQSMVEELTTISRVIADRSTASLSFNDRKSAVEILSALNQESSIVLACIYSHSQTLFAAYSETKQKNCPVKSQADGYSFLSEYFELHQSIILDGKSIGTVYLQATLSELDDRLTHFSILVISIILFAGIIAYFLANKQQAMISNPIHALTNFSKQISIDADYSLRLPQGNNDEIGTLNRAFNNMLKQIHKREVARDKAEQELRKNENNLTITLNSIGDAVIATDANCIVTRMNPVAEQLTGWSLQEAQGQALTTIFPIINAATREPMENPIEKVMNTGQVVHLSDHTTLISRNGTEHQIADSAAPISDNGEILGVVLVFNDVTEQYQLREAAAKNKKLLQAIMDHTPAVIYVKDLEGHFTFLNQQFEKLFNIKYGESLGKTPHKVLTKDTADKMQRSDEAVLKAGNALESMESISQDDGLHSYVTIKFPLFDEKNNAYAVCGISTDITERKQQEEQLRRSQKMDALGKLTGGIAHDYNNMLNVMSGFAQLLEIELNEQPELLKFAHEIKHAGDRGAKLTQKLLAFSRQKTSNAERLNINTLLHEEQHMLEKTLTARIQLILNLADNLWPIWVDSGDLEDTLINLCINAMHAIDGNGQLTLKTCNENITETDAKLLNLDAGDYVTLSITDNGCGMDETTKESIFEPFYSTKGDQGTGLGLSQVYGFVVESKGAIKVKSEPGVGTQFILYFPHYDSNVPTNLHEALPQNDEEHQGSETILVVDDEPALVRLAEKILIKHGYRVLTANNGKQALEVLSTEAVDLLISDVIMPHMNGYELAEKVAQTYPDIKIQIVSGYHDDANTGVINDELRQRYLKKPYTINELLACVRNLLDSL
jgi:PAS domain S-box-containing protein